MQGLRRRDDRSGYIFSLAASQLTILPSSHDWWRVEKVTGLFEFKMKVNGENRPAFVEIMPPGLRSEYVGYVARLEWANLVLPGISQNRIECLGRTRVQSAPEGCVAVRAIGPNPVLIWRTPNDGLCRDDRG